jgi:hypothetical protein
MIEWLHDLEAARKRAREESKFVLVDIFNPG